MAGSLEFAKLVVASLLYVYWNEINKLLRVYLTIACITLMLITSGGIYGFLSGAYQETFAGGTGDGIVLKLSADGQTLLWSTLLGGSLWDFPGVVTVDTDGSIIIAGYTRHKSCSG